MSVFPTGAVTTVTGGVTDAITANIAVVLGVLAFAWGLKYIFKLLNKSTKGHL